MSNQKRGGNRNARNSRRDGTKNAAPSGAWRHPLYLTWNGMLQRCENSSNTNYQKYGARGITVCERWHDFTLWLADLPPKPESTERLTLDRQDNSKGYVEGNLRWATYREQSRNSTSIPPQFRKKL